MVASAERREHRVWAYPSSLPRSVATLIYSIASAFALTHDARGDLREYDLTIAERTISIAGVERQALTINGSVPGPTLFFTEGDDAVIRVHNTLDVSTSLHWHGILLPNAQDGVPMLTTPPIEPGTTFAYHFPISHAGTYWYHSHSGLQEQRGMYGAIVIAPRATAAAPVATIREEVLVLSDWTDEDPVDVMHTLMRGSNWYATRKGSLPTILGALSQGALTAYWQREWSRMAPMDLSDVAYDAFLINGQPRVAMQGTPGERVRLRIVNASASTYFYVQFAGGTMQIIAADGLDVAPIELPRVLMAIGETYDAIITIPSTGAWEFRATAHDGSGSASAFLGEGDEQRAPDVPRADNYSMTGMLKSGMESSGAMTMSADDGRPPPPYRMLRSTTATPLPDAAPRRELTLRLTGNMERYLWSINGLTINQESTIPVREGEVLRFILINDTMMHHPMHLHGHFFRVVGDQGDYSPLKHTVDVPPMGRRVIEFEANAYGDWMFHCHLLYHMELGMGRVVTYAGADHTPSLEQTMENKPFLVVDATVLSNMTTGEARVMMGLDDFAVEWQTGYKPNSDFEYNGVWSHWFDANFSTRLGTRFSDQQKETVTAFTGFDYRLPLLITARIEIDSEGDGRFGASKTFDLATRWSLVTDCSYDTTSKWDWSVGLEYQLTKQLSIVTMYDNEYGFGAGLRLQF